MIKNKIAYLLLLIPLSSQASFIETTIGTAVVNDATASYYNPAALVQLKNPQIIPLGSLAYFHTDFNGQSILLKNGFTESGSSSANSHYYSPSLYAGYPVSNRVTIGLAMVSNFANRDAGENSILRYMQSNNNIQDYDVVPAISIKLTDYFSLGAGVNFSYLNFDLHPVSGIPSLGIPDNESRNDCDGSGVGANAGFLLKATPGTLIGFDYRTLTAYRLKGNSTFESVPPVNSNNYKFTLRTPPRSIFSISQVISSNVGLISTIQYLQWNMIRNIHIDNIATQINSQPVILNAAVPYYLRNSWIFTLGGQYRMAPKWVLRMAGTFNQSPGNGYYQITTGNSVILGISTGYEVSQLLTIDGSYAHAFIQDKNISINNNRYHISGVNSASRDAVSLKLTFNV